MVLTFESVDEILWWDHSNETSLTVLSDGAQISIAELYQLKFGYFSKWSVSALRRKVHCHYSCPATKKIIETNLLKDCFLACTNRSSSPPVAFFFGTGGFFGFLGLAVGTPPPNSSSSPAPASANLGLGVGFGFRSGFGLSRGFATGFSGLAGLAGFAGLLFVVSSLSKSSSML